LAQAATNQVVGASKSAEDLRREARENWLRMRERAKQNLVEPKSSRGRDDDHSL
jgi:hypothetical protein